MSETWVRFSHQVTQNSLVSKGFCLTFTCYVLAG